MLAASISTALEARGIGAVLSGGAAASIYSEGRYLSHDMDFVTVESLRVIEPVMDALGYRRTDGRHFESPEHEFLVEFVSGPLAFGDEDALGEPASLRVGAETLRIITPTQSVMDRLAAYFHWSDPQALEQALLVAERHPVDVDQLRRWARREGQAERFRHFADELAARR